MLIGISPSRWLDDLLATPDIDQTALEQDTLIGWLNDQGFVVSAPMALEEAAAVLIFCMRIIPKNQLKQFPMHAHVAT